MARVCRLQGSDCFYHVLSRGDGRKDIYKSSRDFEKFLEYVRKAKEKYQFYLHAYCLMSNHYHLLLETLHPNLSRIMQYVNTAYTVYYNVKRGKSGHLFQGRYKSILVEQDSYYGELTRYIHRNPLRARIVEKADEYRWSSYRAYLGRKHDGVIDTDRVRECLGMDAHQYKAYLESVRGTEKNPQKEVYAGFLLGGIDFIKEKLEELGHDLETKEWLQASIAETRGNGSRIQQEKIISSSAQCYEQTEEDVRNGKGHPKRSRQVAIYLLRKKTSLTNKAIGEMFNMKEGAVIMAGRVIERQVLNDKSLQKQLKKVEASI